MRQPKWSGGPPPARSRWLSPEENAWPVPVIDVRPFTLAMVSTSTDRQQAANAMSYGNDDGLGFVDQTPPTARTTALDLRYRIDRLLADGALFLPVQMEHKWAVFHHDHHLLVVRSWAREVRLTARTRADGDSLIVVDAVGTISSPDEDPAFTAAAVDFIIRSYCLGEVAPAPLHAEVGDDLQQAEQMSYSLFGNKALLATPHRFAADPPTGVLRSSSLFHIAVARGDLAAAQSQLRVGVPIDLIAQDGLRRCTGRSPRRTSLRCNGSSTTVCQLTFQVSRARQRL